MGNQNSPTLRFPEFKENWESVKLGTLLSFKNGINASREQYGKGVKFINVLDIIKNDFITHDKILGYVDVNEIEFKKNEVKYGDILFQRSSETREEVGQSNVYLDKNYNSTFGGFVIRGQAIAPYIPEFLNYLLKTSSSRNEITTKSGGSTRYNVGQEVLKDVSVDLQILLEQHKIAAFLTALDDNIQFLNKKKTLLEQYKKGVMQQIFNQEIRFKDDDGKNYPDWEEKALGEVCYKKSSNISANSLEENSGDYMIYGAAGISKYVDFYQEETNYISIVKDGAGVGRVFLCEPRTSVLGTLDKIINNEGVSLYFILLQMQQIHFAQYIIGSTIPHIYFKDYSKEVIGLPSLSEQIKIANFLSSLDDKINFVNQQIIQTQQYKKGLLQQMFV